MDHTIALIFVICSGIFHFKVIIKTKITKVTFAVLVNIQKARDLVEVKGIPLLADSGRRE